VRADARPAVGGRLSAVVEAGPDEAARQPRTRVEEAPPLFRRAGPAGLVVVIRTDVAALLVVGVDAAGGDGAALFAAQVRLARMGGMVVIHVLANMVVPSTDVDDFVDAGELVAHGRGVGHGPRGVQALERILHAGRDLTARRCPLNRPLLVGDGPHGNAGMVAIATDELVEPTRMERIAAQQPAFIHDQHAKAVARLKQLRRGRIVCGPVGIAAHLFQLRHAKILKSIRHGRANAGVVLVIARALDDVGLSVQKESLVRVESHGANAEFRLHSVRDLAAA
jgi:hypothetical protein